MGETVERVDRARAHVVRVGVDRELKIAIVEITSFEAWRAVRRACGVAFVGSAMITRGSGLGTKTFWSWVVLCSLWVRMTLRGAMKAVATFERAIGAQSETRDVLGRVLGTRKFAPAERAEAFAAIERVSTTDVWYQMTCTGRDGVGGMSFFDGFRCSGETIAIALEAARRVMEDR